MKSPPSESEPTTAAARLPARIGHEILCAVITAIFCLFELLVMVSEFRVAKLFPGRRAKAMAARHQPWNAGVRRDRR